MKGVLVASVKKHVQKDQMLSKGKLHSACCFLF